MHGRKLQTVAGLILLRHNLSGGGYGRRLTFIVVQNRLGRGGSILRAPDVAPFRRTHGISRSENSSVLGRVSERGESSRVSFMSRRRRFCGEIGRLFVVNCRF